MTADVSVEPGRSIVASAAMTLYTVGTIKDIPGVRRYVAVDGGMSDNPRPVLYGSGYEAFLPRDPAPLDRSALGSSASTASRATSCCSTQRCPPISRSATCSRCPSPGPTGTPWDRTTTRSLGRPIVFVEDGEARLVVRRETFDDLLATDVG